MSGRSADLKAVARSRSFLMDAKMSNIPLNGELDRIYIFRNYPLLLENRELTRKKGTLGSILIIGQGDSFTDLNMIEGLESIAGAEKEVIHKMENVTLRGLGSNDLDINALTLVNLSNKHTFNNISVFNSEDDGIEIFGGNVNMSNITLHDAMDDYFGTDGHSGVITNLKLHQSSQFRGKSLIECGNSLGTTTTKFVNLTYGSQGVDVENYVNNGPDKNFNIKSGSSVEINGVLLTKAVYEIPQDLRSLLEVVKKELFSISAITGPIIQINQNTFTFKLSDISKPTLFSNFGSINTLLNGVSATGFQELLRTPYVREALFENVTFSIMTHDEKMNTYIYTGTSQKSEVIEVNNTLFLETTLINNIPVKAKELFERYASEEVEGSHAHLAMEFRGVEIPNTLLTLPTPIYDNTISQPQTFLGDILRESNSINQQDFDYLSITTITGPIQSLNNDTITFDLGGITKPTMNSNKATKNKILRGLSNTNFQELLNNELIQNVLRGKKIGFMTHDSLMNTVQYSGIIKNLEVIISPVNSMEHLSIQLEESFTLESKSIFMAYAGNDSLYYNPHTHLQVQLLDEEIDTFVNAIPIEIIETTSFLQSLFEDSQAEDELPESDKDTFWKEFYYKLDDFKVLSTDGDNIWQDFQYKGIDQDYTGHERRGGSVGDDVISAHGNEVYGAFAVPIYSDNECSIVMGTLHFVESGRVTDPDIGFSGEILNTMAKVYVTLNDENTLSYGITSNELVSGFYELDKDVIVKIIGNTKTGPFGKNTKVFPDPVDYRSLRIRKINDNIRKCLISTKEDPVTFDSNLSILSSPMTSVVQSTETINKKFYYNGANFKAVSADGSITIYQDYQYVSIDKNLTGHGDDGKVGDYVKNGRGNLARANLSIEITSDRAGLNRIGEMKWIATALIDDPELAVGSQTNGILTTEEIWFKLDGEDEDTICLGHAMNRTDGPNEPGGGYYTVGKDIMVKIIKNAQVGPLVEHGNFTNLSNFKSMRIRNIGGGIRECVVSTDEQPPTFEEGEDPVPVSLELPTPDEDDVEFYYSGDDFISGDMYQDYQYVSIDKDYTGHDEFGKNVQNARGNIVHGIWSAPLYADSELITIIGGITWANSTAIVPEPSLPIMEQDLTVSDHIFITLDNVSTMSVGHTSNVIRGGYYELDRDVLVDIVDSVNQGPLDVNASYTTAAPAFKTCRLRKVEGKLRRGVISTSSIHPALY